MASMFESEVVCIWTLFSLIALMRFFVVKGSVVSMVVYVWLKYFKMWQSDVPINGSPCFFARAWVFRFGFLRPV